jgi:hydroxymethylbilane synthase
MQTFLPAGLTICGYLEREDVRDALISRNGRSLQALPQGARFGTAALRREALIRRARPDFEIGLLRGNVPTRLKRVEEGAFDATLLAAAGLKRLGLESHITCCLPLEEFPPACGQGALAIECRSEDFRSRQLVEPIAHRETEAAVTCERAFLAALDGSCRTPIAGHARLEGGRLQFDGLILSPDGRESYAVTRFGDCADAAAIGHDAGEEIRRIAPSAFLERLGIDGCA